MMLSEIYLKHFVKMVLLLKKETGKLMFGEVVCCPIAKFNFLTS